jgi:hypothetical protein
MWVPVLNQLARFLVRHPDRNTSRQRHAPSVILGPWRCLWGWQWAVVWDSRPGVGVRPEASSITALLCLKRDLQWEGSLLEDPNRPRVSFPFSTAFDVGFAFLAAHSMFSWPLLSLLFQGLHCWLSLPHYCHHVPTFPCYQLSCSTNDKNAK